MEALTAAQSSTVVTFNFVTQIVYIVMMGDEPWFVAADVCEALEIAETHRALARLDDDEKGRPLEEIQKSYHFFICFIVRSKVKTTAFRRSDLSLKPFAVLSCKDGVSIR